ncbi:MAG TPA: hypothetical protein VFE62_00550 [Gemmataceae bacterium]|nr:hypothetical protein [Gemmataceae bacterium]
MPTNKPKKDDRPEKEPEAPAKSNLPLILGGAGCGGFLLFACLAGTCIGIWTYAKPGPAKDGVAQTKDKDGKTGTTDKDNKSSFLKKNYDAIAMGDSVASVNKRWGGQGNYGMQWLPKVAEPGVDAKIAKEMGDRGIKEVWSSQDPAARDVLAIGVQNDRVVFKGYYSGTGGDVRVVYEFTKK